MWSGGLTRWRIWTIIFYPYWQIYGEANLETLTGTDFSPIFFFPIVHTMIFSRALVKDMQMTSVYYKQHNFKGKQNSEQRQCRSIRYTKQFHRELCFVKIIGFLFAKTFSSVRIKYVFKNKTAFWLVNNVLKFHELQHKAFVFCCTSKKWGIGFITLNLQLSALIFFYARHTFFC